MAPVPLKHPVRYTPLAVTGTQLALIVYLTYAVGASLYTSYKALGPAQDTRSRLAQRKKLAPAFLAIAVVAFSVATYTTIASAVLSYKTWAYEHGLDLPQHYSVAGEHGYLPDTNESSQLYLTQWLSDTPFYFDALEIVAEKARRFWWGQQIDLATVAFSMLLAIEGKRRKIPLITAFLTLAHLVNLSFAQSLFFLALLLTPSPLPSGDEDLRLPVVPMPTSWWTRIRNAVLPPKPGSWMPHPAVFLTALVVNFAAIFLLPYAAGTLSFRTIALLTHALTFLPLILPKIVPVKWGTVQSHPHSSYASFTTLFRSMSLGSFLFHAKATLMGLLSNAPDSHYHRHSVFLPWDVEQRSKWERTTTALGKVLGSTSDHPVVAAVGWDVLICAASLGLWAAVRATDIQDILKSVMPFNRGATTHSSHPSAEPTPEEESSSKGSTRAESEIPEELDAEDQEPPMTLRRSGRRPKTRLGSIASSSGASEDVAPPPTSTAARRRGRGRKPKQQQQQHQQPVELEEEKAYEPTPSEAKSAVEGDVVPAGDHLDWESAALTWGLAAFAGLASACAGVFGGECVSR
ncbi:hypothetical protein F4778DRAFT_557354 [Xylariomycetidae sp. FL2044]|nr:hypothetical protein F4778DRAFT_557354 [Xylariomycetidae sp. FL2044]